MTSPRVLVAEDDDNVRHLLRLILELEGYDVTTVADGGAAVRQVEDDVPDLLVLDLMMPVMNGFDVVRAIRSNPDLRDLPIVMLSARSSSLEYERATAVGVDAYVGKPLEPSELTDLIDELLGARVMDA